MHLRREPSVAGKKSAVCVLKFERIAAKRLALQNGHVDDFGKPADAATPGLPTNPNRYDAFPAEFYARICGKMSPIYAYGYEISLHKLPLPSCGILG